ncbi:MAG: alpha-hydroxy acid oxidase [Pseudonocardiaceae bacterium]
MPPVAGVDPAMPLPSCLADMARVARARLPRDVWDFTAGGSGDESTLTANPAAFESWALVPRVLAGASVDPTARLVRDEAAMPVAVAPMAYQRLCHPDGEVAMAEAARRASVPFVCGTFSSCPVEEVGKAGCVTWFQLYWLRDRGRLLDLVARAESAGCSALMVTVDVPVMARRGRDLRNHFAIPADVTAANLDAGPGRGAHRRVSGESAVAAHTNELLDDTVGWSDLEWLQKHTRLPVVLKGILDPRDARIAVELGVDALVVSNHGGRQLAGAAASMAMLPEVVAAVRGRADVLVDSGVRSGVDILRALALGSCGVLVGRPLLWGLSVAGADGAAHVLKILHDELREAMQLAGCPNPASARKLRTIHTYRSPKTPENIVGMDDVS